jgi:AmiR/NasT family two-component response regulator
MDQKILLVEDNVIIAHDIVETLHEIGYIKIDKAASIEAA